MPNNEVDSTRANMDAMRDAFEAWRRSSAKMDPDAAVAREGLGEDATYANRTTRAMWVGWIACALSQYEASRPPPPSNQRSED